MSSIPVGILGATGMVGQQFIALLADHPWFKVAYLGASERSAGKAFKDAAAWRLPNRLPDAVANRVVEAAAPGTAPKLVFSGLDSSVAGEIEAAFAKAGHIVVSNSRNYRMFDTVPLMIPEVNADHLKLLDAQGAAHGWSGRILTNPNCATIVLAMALAPLKQFGINSTLITTLQATMEPLWMPIRNPAVGLPVRSHWLLSSATFRHISVAQATAVRASRSRSCRIVRGVGAPKTAMTASPAYWRMTPPRFMMMSAIGAMNSFSHRAVSPGERRSAIDE